jgi:hypothetical protein
MFPLNGANEAGVEIDEDFYLFNSFSRSDRVSGACALWSHQNNKADDIGFESAEKTQGTCMDRLQLRSRKHGPISELE